MSLHIKSTRSRGISAGRIIGRILSLTEVPKLQSELLEEILVSRSTLSRYITFLREQGLLEQVEIEGKARLKTTPRGEHYLKTKSLLPSNKAPSEEESDNDNGDDNENDEDFDDENESSNRKSATYTNPNWNITPNIG